MTEDHVPDPPQGFVRSANRGPFSSLNGPYFHRAAGRDVTEQAFYALPRHANGMGLVHGGMLAAFMDGLLAGAVGRATGQVGVTIQLSMNYLHMARVGEWVLGEARVTRATRDVAFVEGRAYTGGVDLVRATGVFKLMARRASD